MNWWNKLKYSWSDRQVITSLEVTYDFYTEAGFKVFSVEDIIDHKPTTTYGDYWAIWDKRPKFKKDNTKVFNNHAEKKLKKFRKARKVTLADGIVIPGNYIIKCEWDVYLRQRNATFEEYMELKHE